MPTEVKTITKYTIGDCLVSRSQRAAMDHNEMASYETLVVMTVVAVRVEVCQHGRRISYQVSAATAGGFSDEPMFVGEEEVEFLGDAPKKW